MLLCGSCFHSARFAAGSDDDLTFYDKLMDRQVQTSELVNYFQEGGHRALSDYVFALILEDLLVAFPDAKVVLMDRDPESWFDSFHSTLHRSATTVRESGLVFKLLTTLTGDWDWLVTVNRQHSEVWGPVGKSVFDAIDEGPEAAAKFARDFSQAVKRVVPKEKLLVFNVKEGWAPLCEFLKVPVPEVPFPRVNDRAALSTLLSKSSFVRRFITGALIPFLGGIIAYVLMS